MKYSKYVIGSSPAREIREGSATKKREGGMTEEEEAVDDAERAGKREADAEEDEAEGMEEQMEKDEEDADDGAECAGCSVDEGAELSRMPVAPVGSGAAAGAGLGAVGNELSDEGRVEDEAEMIGSCGER